MRRRNDEWRGAPDVGDHRPDETVYHTLKPSYEARPKWITEIWSNVSADGSSIRFFYDRLVKPDLVDEAINLGCASIEKKA